MHSYRRQRLRDSLKNDPEHNYVLADKKHGDELENNFLLLLMKSFVFFSISSGHPMCKRFMNLQFGTEGGDDNTSSICDRLALGRGKDNLHKKVDDVVVKIGGNLVCHG